MRLRSMLCSGLIVAASVARLATADAATVPTCHGRPATVVLHGGDGRIVGTAGDDVIVGSSGRDRVNTADYEGSVPGGTDYVCGNGGDDFIVSGGGWVDGGSGNDDIQMRGNGTVYGGSGSDRIDVFDKPVSVDCGSAYDIKWPSARPGVTFQRCEETFVPSEHGG